MAEEKPIRVLLSASTQEELNRLYAAFLSDARVSVVSFATSAEMLADNVRTTRPEVTVLDADLAVHLGDRGMVDFVRSLTGTAVVALVPPGLRNLRGTLLQVNPVREVMVKPVSPSALIDTVRKVGISERAASFQAGAAGVLPGAQVGIAPSVAVGTRVMAVTSTKGGTGKTTVAVNLAWRLQEHGVRTLLMGFDVPDDAGIQLGLRRAPNSSTYFRRPSRETFAESLQRKGDLTVCLSPNDLVEASRIAQKAPEEEGSIASLVEMATLHHPPFAAVVMDLPPTETEWSIQPLLRCNTVLLVVQPSVADQIKAIETVRLLTGVLDPRYRVPLSSIYLVFNMVTDEDNLSPSAFQEVMRDHVQSQGRPFAPPVIASIPFDPRIRPLQNQGIVPVSRLDTVRKAVDRIVDFFYGSAIGTGAREQKKGLFGIKIKFR